MTPYRSAITHVTVVQMPWWQRKLGLFLDPQRWVLARRARGGHWVCYDDWFNISDGRTTWWVQSAPCDPNLPLSVAHPSFGPLGHIEAIAHEDHGEPWPVERGETLTFIQRMCLRLDPQYWRIARKVRGGYWLLLRRNTLDTTAPSFVKAVRSTEWVQWYPSQREGDIKTQWRDALTHFREVLLGWEEHGEYLNKQKWFID